MIFIQILKLMLPALIPSWRFFDEIAPSPRIEFSLLKTQQGDSSQWSEFRPRPQHLSGASMLKRLFWNPHWNETLFLVSCSERLLESGVPYYIHEIFKRITSDLPQDTAEPYVKFRLVFVHREGNALQKQVMFVSPLMRLANSELL
ncbi:MAG: hypothetical protein QM709_16735 [Spongiibacteraceae bacterium]